jgi:hypothetical protein
MRTTPRRFGCPFVHKGDIFLGITQRDVHLRQTNH